MELDKNCILLHYYDYHTSTDHELIATALDSNWIEINN